MLLKHKAMFYSRYSNLNDPTECKPKIRQPEDFKNVVKTLKTIARYGFEAGYFQEIANELLERLSVIAEAEQHAFRAQFRKTGILTGERELLEAETFAFMRQFSEFTVGTPFVLSLSKEWNKPQMWSHYASAHTGYCLEFTLQISSEEEGPRDVIYDRTRTDIDLLEVVNSVYNRHDEKNFKKIYFQKSDDWQNEEEARFVEIGYLDDPNEIDNTPLSLPEGIFRVTKNLNLTGIKFGCNSSILNRTKVTEILRRYQSHKVALTLTAFSTNSYALYEQKLKGKHLVEGYQNYSDAKRGGLGGF